MPLVSLSVAPNSFIDVARIPKRTGDSPYTGRFTLKRSGPPKRRQTAVAVNAIRGSFATGRSCLRYINAVVKASRPGHRRRGLRSVASSVCEEKRRRTQRSPFLARKSHCASLGAHQTSTLRERTRVSAEISTLFVNEVAEHHPSLTCSSRRVRQSRESISRSCVVLARFKISARAAGSISRYRVSRGKFGSRSASERYYSVANPAREPWR